MSALSSAICVILLLTSAFGIERKHYFHRGEKHSKIEWTIIGVCTLKFPNGDANVQFNKCIDEQQLPFDIEGPMDTSARYPELTLVTKWKCQVNELVSELDYNLDRYITVDNLRDRLELENDLMPVMFLLLRKADDGIYYFVDGEIGLPKEREDNTTEQEDTGNKVTEQDEERNNLTMRTFFIEKDDMLFMHIAEIDPMLQLRKLDNSFKTLTYNENVYSIRTVIDQF